VARVEYAHPSMTAAVADVAELPPGPRFQRLEDGWIRVRPCWRQPLTAVLGARVTPAGTACTRQLAALAEGLLVQVFPA
jgi:hypothetical protein